MLHLHHLPHPARRLHWDTDFFGFPVAVLEDPALGDEELARVLAACRHAGVVLVYWNAVGGRVLAPERLAEFGGVLLERRLTFTRALPAPHGAPSALPIEPFPHGLASEELFALALVAGGRSRFRVDPRVPPGKFEGLYRSWIDRSCDGELADAVLVAKTHAGKAAGMITLDLEPDAAARIALVAVAAEHRGKGLGLALVDAAHRFMEAHGARLSRVVTQGENAEACALYARAGYTVAEERAGHHFWLANPSA